MQQPRRRFTYPSAASTNALRSSMPLPLSCRAPTGTSTCTLDMCGRDRHYSKRQQIISCSRQLRWPMQLPMHKYVGGGTIQTQRRKILVVAYILSPFATAYAKNFSSRSPIDDTMTFSFHSIVCKRARPRSSWPSAHAVCLPAIVLAAISYC